MFTSMRMVLLWVALIAAAPAAAEKVQTGFLDSSVVVENHLYKYQVFVPEDWSASKKWPVIVFLHGIGESGDDGLIETEVGIGSAIRRDRARFPAIVVLPQSPKGHWWSEPPMDRVVIAALDAASKKYHGDSHHTYLTGLSMGGYGTWSLAAQYPGRFAALAPVCGGVMRHKEVDMSANADTKPYEDMAVKIGAKTPVWIFHGGDDPVVPVIESRRMYQALTALGGEVHYTEYPGVGHDSWVKAYDEPELISWLLSKSL